MQEQLISFETAKLAKEKGFEHLGRGYISDGSRLERMKGYANIPAPTQSLLQKWLREVHNIHVNCIPNFKTTWFQYHLGIMFKNEKQQVDMIIIKEDSSTILNKLFDSYEEALEEGLKKALELC